MTPVIAIMLMAVGVLVAVTLIKGFEEVLAFFAFLVIILPGEARIDFGDLFMLTTTRALIATLAVLYLMFGAPDPRGHPNGKLPLKYILLAYMGWSVVSTLNSITFATSLKAVLSLFLDFYVIYYVYSKSVHNVETIHKILAAIVAALVVCCVFGVVERSTGWKVIELFPEVTHRFTPGEGGLLPDFGRVKATFPHAILFANALALGIPLTLYLQTLAKTGAQKVCLWAALVIMFYNIYKTESRGPWLALALSLLVLLLFSPGNIRRNLLVIALLTVSALIIRPGVWDTLRNTYFETFDPETARGESYQYRYELMRVAREAVAKDLSRAVWGFGPNSWDDLGFEGVDPDTGHTVKYDSCDSAFVAIMVETGYVGLLLVAALLLIPASLSLRGYSQLPKPANLLCLVLLINIVAYAFMMASVDNFGWGQQTYMLWIILALSMAYPALVQSKGSEKAPAAFPQHETELQMAEVSQPRA